MKILERFSKHLSGIEYPKEKTSWNIAGMLKGKNAFYRFDVREMFNMPNGIPAQSGRLDSQAQKMVIEGEKEWLILDLEELHEYIRREKKKELYINDLISDLEWTIFLTKN
jgi:hypothetical protein